MTRLPTLHCCPRHYIRLSAPKGTCQQIRREASALKFRNILLHAKKHKTQQRLLSQFRDQKLRSQGWGSHGEVGAASLIGNSSAAVWLSVSQAKHMPTVCEHAISSHCTCIRDSTASVKRQDTHCLKLSSFNLGECTDVCGCVNFVLWVHWPALSSWSVRQDRNAILNKQYIEYTPSLYIMRFMFLFTIH